LAQARDRDSGTETAKASVAGLVMAEDQFPEGDRLRRKGHR
jgi:hypothetical protein